MVLFFPKIRGHNTVFYLRLDSFLGLPSLPRIIFLPLIFESSAIKISLTAGRPVLVAIRSSLFHRKNENANGLPWAPELL